PCPATLAGRAMGFWDKLKAMIGGGGAGGDEPPADDLTRRVEAVVVRYVTRKEPFEAITVAAEVADPRSITALAAASGTVARLHDEGRFEPLGYTRTKLADGNWLYHPTGYAVASYRGSSGASAPAASPPPTAPSIQSPRAAPAQAPAAKPRDPFTPAVGILGLSADELRKRALRINPYQTAWIG